MNPFLQLGFLLLSSAGIFGIKQKFMTGSNGTSENQSLPTSSSNTAHWNSAAPMLHNRPRMKRPSRAPNESTITEVPNAINAQFSMDTAS